MNRLLSVLFWSVISAAFIGPGTVTTCATAGAQHGPALLWALVFSTLSCLVLQEASARVTVTSGLELGQAIRSRHRRGAGGVLAVLLVLGAVVLGCAAYQAGNMLGAVAGAALAIALPPAMLTLIIGALAGLLLWLVATRAVARLLGVLVAGMGLAFLVTAVSLKPDPGELLRGAVVPTLPQGSGTLVLGLIGTTVVPYNLFLGSGLARGQRLRELRFGLAVAIGLGGLISMGVLVVGTAVPGAFGFQALAEALSTRLGPWARLLFATGLFAAGLSSAITAPLAAAVTARGLAASERSATDWNERGWRFRAVWVGVLLTGLVLGVADLRPAAAIVLAQALNGVLLPFSAVFLMIAVNDRALTGSVNGRLSNLWMSATIGVTIVLGTRALIVALNRALDLGPPGPALLWSCSLVLAVLVGLWTAREVRRARR